MAAHGGGAAGRHVRLPSIDALESELERRFVTTRTRLTMTDRVLELVHPRSAEDLIDEAEFERDERMPYWAELWPSGVMLAEGLSGLDGHGLRLLELGCGVGLVATAAVLSGFTVLATDYYEDALHFTRVNVARNTNVDPETRLLDWRSPPEDLGTFDVVVGADVLYERPYSELIASLLTRTLSLTGRGMIADPGRLATPQFRKDCERLGLTVGSLGKVPFASGAIRQEIEVLEIRRGPTEDGG